MRDKNGRFIKGHSPSEEVRNKIGAANKGRPSPKKGKRTGIIPKTVFKKGHVPYLKGKHHKPESLEKNRNAHLGKAHSAETKLKMSIKQKGHPAYFIAPGEKHPMYGKKHTQEAILKISLAGIGREVSQETRKKKSKSMMGKKNMLGKHHSEETKRKIAAANSGSKNVWWKGGITPINKKIRASWEYRLWRDSVFKRDNWTCVLCNNRSGKGNYVELQADHIKPFAYFPQLRYDIDNGRTLCVSCHRKTDTWGGRANEKYNTERRKDLRIAP